MKIITALLLGTATAASSCSPLLAQSDGNQLEEIVVVANRIPLPLRQIATSISVINAEEIAAHGNTSLTNVLRQLPSIGISSNGGAGTTTSLRIRGEEGFRTQTRFDSLKLADPSGTQVGPQLQHLLSAGIGRVEVLRGPQGLSYGADAGGIINISSLQTEESFTANIDAQGGSFGTQQLAANIGGAIEKADFFVSLSDFETDGFNTRDSDSVLADDDGYENTTIHARLGFDITDDLRLDVTHRNVQGETQFDGCFSGGPVHDCASDYDLEASRLGLEYTVGGFTHSLAFSITETDRENYTLGNSSFTAAGDLERWEYIGAATELNGFDVIFGFDLEQESNNGVNRDNEGYYIELLSDFSDNFYVTAGVRQDENDDFGSHTSYRISAAYLVELSSTDTLKFKSSFGTGFRAPSPGEVAYNAGAFAAPPASLVILKEEQSEGYELGFEYFSGNDTRLELVLFNQEVEDAIFFDLVGFSGYLQDIGNSESKGYELSGEYTLNNRWRLTANYTHNETERPNGLQRRRRPEELANIGVMYKALNDKLKINAFYRTSSDAIDEQFGSPVALEDFEVLDITASYSVSDAIEIYGRLENALDENYQEIIDFNSADRASYIGVRLNF
jgi:vitamin B12 transporter|tara:strand:- start:2998 stop:4854 length:1857 start_codon:yes stop_codon:yes gene_type:complete